MLSTPSLSSMLRSACESRLRATRVALLLVAVVAVVAVSTSCTKPQDDKRAELYDFATTTTEFVPSTPYDAYVKIAQQIGTRVLDFRTAEARAEALCAHAVSTTTMRNMPATADLALIRAYCPEIDASG